jgi:hypothetical protein
MPAGVFANQSPGSGRGFFVALQHAEPYAVGIALNRQAGQILAESVRKPSADAQIIAALRQKSYAVSPKQIENEIPIALLLLKCRFS